MKKFVYGIAALTLSASILGGCGNEDTASKAGAETKQEATQENVKELPVTSKSDKEKSKMVHSFAASVEGKSEKEKDKLYEQTSRDTDASSMFDRIIRHGFKDSYSPVSDYEAFLNTYTGKNNYKYTEDSKKQAEKVLKDMDVIVEQYKKDTGAKDLSNVTASLTPDDVKIKDNGNNEYTATAKISVLGDAGNKEYTVVSNAVFNNVIGFMQAKDIKLEK